MGASFSLPFLSAETGAAFDKLPEELLMRVVRTLLRDDPQAVCRLVSASRVLRQLLPGDSVEAAELRAARSLLTEQRLFELRVAAGLESEGGVPALVRSVSRQLSFVARGPPAPARGFPRCPSGGAPEAALSLPAGRKSAPRKCGASPEWGQQFSGNSGIFQNFWKSFLAVFGPFSASPGAEN